MATLGISTNTRLVGFAIIHQGQLVDYSLHLHKSPWSASKANKIITSLEPCVRRYSIKTVVLSMPHAYHQTKAFKLLVTRLKAYFKAKIIPVIPYPPEALSALCSAGEKKTKKALMKTVAEQFPELFFCYQKELRNKNKYYIKLFEAVAAATLHELQK